MSVEFFSGEHLVVRRQDIVEAAIDGPHSDERETIILAGRPELSDSATSRLNTLLTLPLDWDYISATAFKHGVLQWVCSNVRDLGRTTVDRSFVRKLEVANLVLSTRQKALAEALGSIIRKFEESSIPVLTFKGPALSALVYGSPFVRFSADADILVPREHASAATEVLVQQGYQPSFDVETLAKLLDRTNAATFLHADGNVDLHWTLDDGPFRTRLDDVWRSPSRIDVGGVMVSTLNELQLFSFLCYHGAKHAWPRLSWIIDLARFLAPELKFDLDELLVRSVSRRNDLVVALGLVLASSFCELPLSPQTESWLEARKKAWRLARRAAHSLFEETAGSEFHLFRLATLQRPSDKVRFLAHRAVRHFRPGIGQL